MVYLQARKLHFSKEEFRDAVNVVFGITARATVLTFSLDSVANIPRSKALLAEYTSKFWLVMDIHNG